MSTILSRLQLRLLKFEVILASLLLFLPLILILIDGQVRPSISNYFYMDSNQWFVSLLTIASLLFIINGVINNKKSYNILLGVSLWIVAIAPHKELQIIHFVAAAIFFIGSEFVMVRYSTKSQRKYMWLLASIINIGMVGHFVFGWYSLLIAEWIGLLPITAHFIGESLNKIK